MVRCDRRRDHARHRDGGRRQHDAVVHRPFQLSARRAVEHRHEQADAGSDVLHGEAVAQGTHVVVEQDGNPVDVARERRAQLGVGGIGQVHGADAALDEQRAGTPTDVGVPDHDDAREARGGGLGTVYSLVGGPRASVAVSSPPTPRERRSSGAAGS